MSLRYLPCIVKTTKVVLPLKNYLDQCSIVIILTVATSSICYTVGYINHWGHGGTYIQPSIYLLTPVFFHRIWDFNRTYFLLVCYLCKFQCNIFIRIIPHLWELQFISESLVVITLQIKTKSFNYKYII